MNKQTPLLLYPIVFLWFYTLTFIQFSNPFNLSVIILFLIFYTLLYLGYKNHLIPNKLRPFIALGAFTTTFSMFWTSIIYLVFYFAELLPDKNPVLLIVSALINAPLYVLFYQQLARQKQPKVSDHGSALHFILEITFPILTAVGFFTGTLLLYSQINQPAVEGLTLLITVAAVTVLGTVLTSHLFEGWLAAAEKRSMEKVLVALMAAGIVFTMILVRNSLL